MKHLLYSIILMGFLLSCGTENKPTYKVTTTVSPTEGGTITLSPSGGVYSEGETVTITGNPSNGWRFVRWEGDWSGETNPSTITMNKDYTVVGIFVKRNYPLTIEVEGYGEVLERVIQQKTTEYPYQTVVELTPVPDENYEFVEWGGDLSGSEVPKTITVDGEKTVVAKFRHILEGRKLQRVDSSLSPGGSSTSFQTYTYDSNENLIELIYYNSVGGIIDRRIYTYDSNNNLIERISYRSDGSISSRWTYSYDSNNNLIEQINHTPSASLIVRSTYSYDSNNNLIEQIDYNREGEISGRAVNSYDSNNNLIERISYRSDGSISSRWTYTYDSNNNLIEQIIYGSNGEIVSRTLLTYDSKFRVLTIDTNHISFQRNTTYEYVKDITKEVEKYNSKTSITEYIDKLEYDINLNIIFNDWYFKNSLGRIFREIVYFRNTYYPRRTKQSVDGSNSVMSRNRQLIDESHRLINGEDGLEQNSDMRSLSSNHPFNLPNGIHRTPH